MYDLIIGALSIRKNNILDVPNLMVGNLILATHLRKYSKICMIAFFSFSFFSAQKLIH